MARDGVLLVNLGSPDSPEPKDVKRYLQQFLTDPYVIDIPAVFRYLLVYGWIAPKRSHSSSEAYKKIWTVEGSPLVSFTKKFAEKVAAINENPDVEIRWAMRYGSPSIQDVIQNWNVERLKVIPLYPQFADSSTQTALDEVVRSSNSKNIWALNDFYEEPEFIASYANQINKAILDFKPDQILLSFHGLPEHHMNALHPNHCLKSPNCCDKITSENQFCYRAQTQSTARAIRASVPFPKIDVSYQSRLGRRPWIKPYTDVVVSEYAARGVKRLLVSCPSFVADCLETLEEIQIRLKEQFVREGGEDLMLVPALNAEEHWVKGFTKMISRKTLAWTPLNSQL